MAMITTLTDAQWAQMREYREMAYQVGSACGPSDREATKAVLTQMYAAIGYTAPRYLFLPSPLSVLWATEFLQKCEQIGGEIDDKLGDQIWAKIWTRLGDQLWSQLGNQLRGFFYGGHQQYWIAYYVFMSQIGVSYPETLRQQLHWWDSLGHSCGWWMPYSNVCLIADRPVTQSVDEQRRLHCATGPAMAFGDGFAIWSWHGVRVTQQIIETPDTLTVEGIRGESNAEVQRIMIERFGWDRYLDATQAVLLDSDVDNSGRGTLRGLYRTMIREIQPATVLVCTCDSTGKTFHLEVPPTVTTCRQAAGWLAQDPDLHLLVQS